MLWLWVKSTVKVDKAPTKITGTDRYEKLLGGENFTVDAVSDKNLSLAYEVTSGENVSVTGDSTVKINGISESVITVSSSNENNENYVDASLDVIVNVTQNIIKPAVENPTATDIYVGQSLADFVLSGNASVDGKYGGIILSRVFDKSGFIGW